MNIPPHSQEAESGVLGSILIHAPCYASLRAETDLCSECFYVPAHRAVWEAMEGIAGAGRPIDVYTVIEALRASGSLERAGGGFFVDGLAEGTPTHAHVETYAETVIAKWRLRTVAAAGSDIQRQSMGPEADGQEVAAKGIASLLEVLKVREPDTSIQDDTEAALTEWDTVAQMRRAGQPVVMPGLPTGLARVDYTLNGLQAGLIVLGARQSTGKTTIAMQMAGYVCRNACGPVLHITRDSLRRRLIDRELCREAQCDLSALTKGYMNAVQRDRLASAKKAVDAWPMKIEPNVWKIQDVCALIRADVHKRGTKLVTLDYIQLFSTGNRAADNDRNGKLETIMGALKNLVFDAHIPILILSQFARDKDATKGRVGNWLSSRPIMEDLKDSGALEQLADQAMLLSKVDDILDEDGNENNRTIVACDVAKNKQGGTKVVFLDFHRPVFTMTELSAIQQKAVVKALRDEGKKPDKCEHPYFSTVQDAMNRSHLMEGK
jgi:replicative DNA helicase